MFLGAAAACLVVAALPTAKPDPVAPVRAVAIDGCDLAGAIPNCKTELERRRAGTPAAPDDAADIASLRVLQQDPAPVTKRKVANGNADGEGAAAREARANAIIGANNSLDLQRAQYGWGIAQREYSAARQNMIDAMRRR